MGMGNTEYGRADPGFLKGSQRGKGRKSLNAAAGYDRTKFYMKYGE